MNGIDERLGKTLAKWARDEVESWVGQRAYRSFDPSVSVGSTVYTHTEVAGEGCASAENAARALVHRLRQMYGKVLYAARPAVVWRIFPMLRRDPGYAQTWSYYAELSFVAVSLDTGAVLQTSAEEAPHEDAASGALLRFLTDLAKSRSDGHLTIMRFTTNWRVGFETPGDIQTMAEGTTFAAAAFKAICEAGDLDKSKEKPRRPAKKTRRPVRRSRAA